MPSNLPTMKLVLWGVALMAFASVFFLQGSGGSLIPSSVNIVLAFLFTIGGGILVLVGGLFGSSDARVIRVIQVGFLLALVLFTIAISNPDGYVTVLASTLAAVLVAYAASERVFDPRAVDEPPRSEEE